MKAETLEVSVKWENGAWAIRPVGDNRGPGIRVDSLVINATSNRYGAIQGTIETVHGLDQEVAACLSPALRQSLGVGVQYRTGGRRSKFGKRTHLMPGGDIQGGIM